MATDTGEESNEELTGAVLLLLLALGVTLFPQYTLYPLFGFLAEWYAALRR